MIRTTGRRRLPLTALAIALVAGTALAGAVPAQAADAAASSRTPGASASAAAANLPAPLVTYPSLSEIDEPSITVSLARAPGTSDTTGLDFQYQLDGGPWQVLAEASTDAEDLRILAPAGKHLISFRIAGKIDGVFTAGTGTTPQDIDFYGYPKPYEPVVVVDGPRITVSWDVRDANNGWPGAVTYYVVDDEYTYVDEVGSVTFEPGYDSSLDLLFVYGPNTDAPRFFREVFYTGSAPGGASLTSVPTPAIVGRPIVGTTLSVRTGLWQPAPVDLSYQWYSDGEQIFGATGPTYEVSSSESRTRITVAVRGTRAGYASQTRMSAPTPRVPVPVVTAGRPTIRGKAVVGGTLTVNPGSWKPAFLELTYEWFRDGERIDGATGTTYQPTAADRGHDITVLVSSDDLYYNRQTAVSAARRVA
ncbi:hypothetical protein [Clavibacter michiganensis]|uniref:hypothetical protein n=1 Tax=Clavibacter michiganensis TaxID=28447 RepID=UPI003EBE48C8